MIEIKSILGETLLSVPILDDAVSREELMMADYVQLSWLSDSGAVLPNGSYIIHNDEKYSLLEDYRPSRVDEAEYRYTPQFHSRVVRWQKAIVPVYTYSDNGGVKTRELDWDFTGSPSGAMSMIQQAVLNETGEQWEFAVADGLPETVTLHSESSSIWSMLSELAELCETEWWADKEVNYIHLGKCERGERVTLTVGQNIGVPSSTQNDDGYYTRFYAFGSTRNITQSESAVQGSYVNKRLTLDPKKYPNGYKDIKGHFENGVFVSDLLPEEVYSKPLYFDDVYPSSRLRISDVRKRMRYYLNDGEKVVIGGTEEEPIYDQYPIWYFKIHGLEFDESLLIGSLPLSVAFKSGQLRGREFELHYYVEDKKVADAADVDKDFAVTAGEYEIIFDDQSASGMIIPSDTYIVPSNGDEVVLFNIEMPKEYTDSAYLDLEAKLDEEIERRTKDNKSYEFRTNPVAFYEDAAKTYIGQPVTFVNGDSTLETRVMMVEARIDHPFDRKIKVGNEIIKGSRQQLREEVKNIDESVSKVAGAAVNQSVNYTKRTWRDAKATISLLEAAMKNFSKGINPVTIETMNMLVGDERRQYVFTDGLDSDGEVEFTYGYQEKADEIEEGEDGYEEDEDKKVEKDQITFFDMCMKHMTLGLEGIRPKRDDKDYKRWAVAGRKQRLEKDKAYYLYAVCSKAEESSYGTFYAYEEAMDDTHENYYFLVGILTAVTDGERSFARMYGYTEVSPARIVTEKIISSDGKTWLDLLRGILHLNDKAGVSGVIDKQKGDSSIAAWFGGQMIDRFLDPASEDPAETVFRHDGSGYLAQGKIRFDGNGGLELDNGIKISGDVDNTLGKLTEIIMQLSKSWAVDPTTPELFTTMRTRVDNDFVVLGDIASGGKARSTDAEGTVTGIVVGDDYYGPNSLGIIDLSAAFDGSQGPIDLSNYYTKDQTLSLLSESLAPYLKEEDANALYVLRSEYSGVGEWAQYISYRNGIITIGANVVIEGDLGSRDAGQNTPTLDSITGVKVGSAEYTTVSAGLLDLTDLFKGYATSKELAALSARVDAIGGGSGSGSVNVTVTQTLTDGIEIASINVDGVTTELYAPEVGASDILGSSAIGSTSAYPYWNGSQWKTRTLGDLAFVDALDYEDVGVTKDVITTLLGTTTYAPYSADGYLSKAGDTITGDLRLKGSGNYGNTLYFGDSDYCYIAELSDDVLTIYGSKGINLATYEGDVKINDERVLTASDLDGLFDNDIAIDGDVTPSKDETYNLGVYAYQWKNVYAVNGIFSGDQSSGSDIRFKDTIENIKLSVEAMANAPLFTFKWNDREDDMVHLGSSAQYWEKSAPWLVTGDEFKTLNYSVLGVAMGISLAEKAMNHEERIKTLEKENEALKEELRRVKHD